MPFDLSGTKAVLADLIQQRRMQQSPQYQAQLQGMQLQNQQAMMQMEQSRQQQASMNAFVEEIANAPNVPSALKSIARINPNAALEFVVDQESQRRAMDALKAGNYDIAAVMMGKPEQAPTFQKAQLEGELQTKAPYAKQEQDWQTSGQKAVEQERGYQDRLTLQKRADLEKDQPPKVNLDLAKFHVDLSMLGNDINKDFKTVDNNVNNIIAASNELIKNPRDKRIAIDETIITSYKKILDPQSVVRESEYARTQISQGLFDRIKTWSNRMSTGESLTKDNLLAIRDIALELHEWRRQNVNAQLESQVRSVAGEVGLNPDTVAPLNPAMSNRGMPTEPTYQQKKTDFITNWRNGRTKQQTGGGW